MRDQEIQPIFKGRISEWGPDKDDFGAPTQARVIPVLTPDAPTPLYNIAYICRYPRFDLDIDSIVVCARFEDGTGMILMPFEDEFTRHVPGDLWIDKGALPDGDVHVEESVRVKKDVSVDGDVEVKGTVTADVDVIGGGKSLKGHTHTGVHGPTSPPN